MKLVMVPPLLHSFKAMEVAEDDFALDLLFKGSLIGRSTDVVQSYSWALPGSNDLRVSRSEFFGDLIAIQLLFRVQGNMPHAHKSGDADAASDKDAVPLGTEEFFTESTVGTVNGDLIPLLE